MRNKIIEQIEKIKQINSNENLVIFVGAGVSKNSGVCSWWELVKEIADKIGENKCTSCEIKDLICGECGEQIEMCSINGYNCKLKYDFSAEDFLRIPQHFYECFGDTEEEKKLYYDFLKEKFCSDEYETNIIDEIIVKLQPEHIITTNYDHLLENVNDPRVSKYAVITKDDDILSKKGRNYIIKMHGDIDDIQNIVLKEDDYLNYSQNHTKSELFHLHVFDPYNSYPVLDEDDDRTGWNIYMFRADDESIENIMNSRFAVRMELPELITDYDSFYADLGFSKEAIQNKDVRSIKLNARYMTVSDGTNTKEIETNRLKKYNVTIQTQCIILKIKTLWNRSENNLYGMDKRRAIKCIPNIEDYAYVPVNNSMLAKAEIPFLIFERNRGKCFIEMY